MKKWLFPVAAAAVALAGCGGGGNNGGGGVVAGGGNGDSVATANIPNTPPLVGFDYLTGQGRATGDTIATISTPTIIDSSGVKENPRLGNVATLDLNGAVNGGTQNLQYVNVLDVPNGNSHQFSTYELILDQIGTQNADGSVTVQSPPSGSNTAALDAQFAAQVGAFPGRQTTVQVYLNDGMVSVDSSGNGVIDRTQFLSANTSTDNTFVSGYFSDYVMFDISHVTNLPNLSDGSVGTRVYFNGDKIGASGSTPGGLFQVFTPTITLTGVWAGPTSLTNYGTYALKETSPTDITQTIKITSLQGTWRTAAQSFNNLGNFEVVLFPHNTDDNFQDIVAFVSNSSGQITNFYFGLADLSAKTFAIYPIAQVETGDASNEIDGTITTLLDASGNTTTDPATVRQGHYTISGTLPTGFRASGRYLVYRR